MFPAPPSLPCEGHVAFEAPKRRDSRRNHNGSKSKRGTEVAALFYSLFETASMVGVDPKAYLRAAAAAGLKGRAPLLPQAYKAATADPA